MNINDQRSISGNPNNGQHWKEKGYTKTPPKEVRDLPKVPQKKQSGNNHKTIRAKKS